MKVLGCFLAFLVALLLVPAVACAVWSFSTSEMLLSADTYKNAFLRQGAYEVFIPAAFPILIEELPVEAAAHQTSPQFLEVVQTLEETDWASIATELTPPDWVREQLETNLDAFFAWLNDETPTLDVGFDIAFLRNQLSGEAAQRVVNRIIQSWPPCTGDQIDALAEIDPQDASAALPHCRPPEENLADSSAALLTQLQSVVDQMPDTLPDPEHLNSPATRLQLEELKRSVRLARALVIELWLLPLALLALIVFFTVRSLKSFGRWAGWTLIVGGLLTVLPIPLLLSPFLLPSFASSVATSMGREPLVVTAEASPGAGPVSDGGPVVITPEAPPAEEPGGDGGPISVALGTGGPGRDNEDAYLATITEGIVRSLVSELTLPVLIQAAVVIALGLLALVVATLIRSPEEAQADELNIPSLAATAAGPATPAAPTGWFTPTPAQRREGEPPPSPGGGDSPPPMRGNPPDETIPPG